MAEEGENPTGDGPVDKGKRDPNPNMRGTKARRTEQIEGSGMTMVRRRKEKGERIQSMKSGKRRVRDARTMT